MPPHSILIRQLRRCELPEGAAAGMPAGWETFLEFVDNAYREADEERTLQDNMLASLSAAKTNPSCCRSAIPHATGAM